MSCRTALAALCVAAALTLAGCNGINLGDNPGPDVKKQTGPLTVPPPHLKNGASE